MHFPIRGRFVVLFSAVFLSLAFVAACGDDGGGSNGATPQGSFIGVVGEGSSPLEAVGTVLSQDGLDGHLLDIAQSAPCPLEEVQATPGVVARYSLGQFCLTFFDITSTQGGVTEVENREDGGVWDFELSVDDGHWKVESMKKVGDGSS